jgi:transposase
MARTPSRFVRPVSDEEQEILGYLKDHGETWRIRHRAHAILLSDSGRSVNEIAEIFETTRVTVCSWFARWEASGPQGLADGARSGAPPKLTKPEKKKVVKLIKKYPHSPKQVLNEIPQVIGKTISQATLRRIARASGLRWKRMRKSLKSKRDEEDFEEAQEELEVLIESHQAGELDLYYFDEAGISLTPTVPYGWQPIGERIEIPSQRSKQLNTLGFLRYDNQLTSYTVEGSVDSEIVIGCFEDFSNSLTRNTTVVIDNAPVHTSKKFESRIPIWEDKGLFLYFLPSYCPELNLIEILWRMIKYHWLPIKAYDSFKSLLKHVHQILSQVGARYTINFAQHTG